MGTPHKHAEIIKAWADGAEVQQRYLGDDWEPFDGAWSDLDNWKFRIKPEPKPDVVWYAAVDSAFDKELGFYATTHHDKRIDSLKLTFDGETGALKAAEVLK